MINIFDHTYTLPRVWFTRLNLRVSLSTRYNTHIEHPAHWPSRSPLAPVVLLFTSKVLYALSSHDRLQTFSRNSMAARPPISAYGSAASRLFSRTRALRTQLRPGNSLLVPPSPELSSPPPMPCRVCRIRRSTKEGRRHHHQWPGR
jgi:hypothetical protein